MKPEERLVLAIDTTGESFSLALGRAGKVLAEYSGGQPRQHLVQIFPSLRLLCQLSEVAPESIQAIAVTAGPGSFTGIRTGLLIARTLSLALNIPVFPMDTLEVLARNTQGESVVAGLDARKGEVVWARFRVRGRSCVALDPPVVEKPETFAASIPSGSLVLGSICEACRGALAGRGDITILPRSLWSPRAALMLAMTQGQSPVAWTRLRPGYVRPADVQVHQA